MTHIGLSLPGIKLFDSGRIQASVSSGSVGIGDGDWLGLAPIHLAMMLVYSRYRPDWSWSWT